MGNAPKSAGGRIAKYLDVEITKSNGFTFDFSSIEGYEKLTTKNFFRTCVENVHTWCSKRKCNDKFV